MELFHKNVQQPLGFEAGAPSGFAAVMAHAYGVDGADLVLHRSPPRVALEAKRLGDKQRHLQHARAHKAKRRSLQQLTQIGGVPR